jgi:hypothetical protein
MACFGEQTRWCQDIVPVDNDVGASQNGPENGVGMQGFDHLGKIARMPENPAGQHK